VLNLVDGENSMGEIRDAVAAAYGPVPLELVTGYLDVLEALGVIHCSGPIGLAERPREHDRARAAGAREDAGG
jgi:hypothetical protein